jgi:hypothetical protein
MSRRTKKKLKKSQDSQSLAQESNLGLLEGKQEHLGYHVKVEKY